MEKLIYVALLALHNVALVGCVAAPFYNLRLTGQRGKLGPTLKYELDRVVENTIQGNEPFCWAFIMVLYATGFGFPLVRLLFHGALPAYGAVVLGAFVLKHVFVAGIVALAFYVTFGVHPKLRALFAAFKPGEAPAPETERAFFALRARRRKVCKVCLALGIGVLVVSPVLRFYTI